MSTHRRNQPIRPCKLKRVYTRRPLHVHSAEDKRLTQTTAGNPDVSERRRKPPRAVSEWSLERLRELLQTELSAEARARLDVAAKRLGMTFEELLRAAISEAP